MTSPERQKHTEAEYIIHNDTTQCSRGEKTLLEEEKRGTHSNVMHNTVRYSINNIKLNAKGNTVTSNLPHKQTHKNCNEKENWDARCKEYLTGLNASTVNSDLNSIDILDGEVLISDFEGGVEETKATRIERQLNKIEQLKENLICEEATLYILRKLIDSQRVKNRNKQVVQHLPVTSSLHPKKTAQIAQKVSLPHKPLQYQIQHAQKVPKVSLPHKELQYQTGKRALQPASNSASVQKYYIQVGNQLVPAHPVGTLPNGSVHQYANGGAVINSHTTYQPRPTPPKPALSQKETLEQKQNAAKCALRKQLEQTLLQIPLPRPPPADWKAIPQLNCMDFMMLVGLDSVSKILDMDSKPALNNALEEELMSYNPHVCCQCGVDFSPCWKNKDENSKDFVLCERCALQNVKKDLQEEHTSILKLAFLKGLKREKEVEAKIQAGEDVNVANLTSPSLGVMSDCSWNESHVSPLME